MWWNYGARMRPSYWLIRSGEDAMQRSAGRQGEWEVGISRAGDSTVDPRPTARGSSLAAATVDTALWQQITSPASCSYSFRPDLLGLQILITVFILFTVSSQQGLGLPQGTVPLWGAHCPTADRASEVRAANTSELGTVWLWGATAVLDLEEELNIGRRALWISWGKYYWVQRWEIMSNPPPQNICMRYIAGRSTLGPRFQLAG